MTAKRGEGPCSGRPLHFEMPSQVGVTVNPVSAYGWKFDKDEFREKMQAAVDVPVMNVKEELG